jgi:non-heme chloroperoxidase
MVFDNPSTPRVSPLTCLGRVVDVPVLVMHGDDDQIVPIADSALLSAKLVKHGPLKVYEGLSHGMCTTHPEVINGDLLAFIRS